MNPDAVIKIGGSLSHGAGLPDLCSEISRLGKSRSLLVVPGGGKFANQVREAYGQFNLTETAAHRMALLAMDQYGYVLNHLIPNSFFISDPFLAHENLESGKVAILLPSAAVFRLDPLPHSWEITSDTIAAWVAHLIGCPRLVLIKDVDGLMTTGDELIEEISVELLTKHSGGVDGYLSRFLSANHIETWIINGAKPERLSELLKSGRTKGTRIR
jgi:5-(aminomethyl)-3-furanmethanol phosphate kinase